MITELLSSQYHISYAYSLTLRYLVNQDLANQRVSTVVLVDGHICNKNNMNMQTGYADTHYMYIRTESALCIHNHNSNFIITVYMK